MKALFISCTESRPLKYTRYILSRKGLCLHCWTTVGCWVITKTFEVCMWQRKSRGRGGRWVGRWRAVRWTTAIVFMMLRTVWTPRKDEYLFGHLTPLPHHGSTGSLPSWSVPQSPFNFSLQTTSKTEKQLQKIGSNRRAFSQLIEHKHEINWLISWMY